MSFYKPFINFGDEQPELPKPVVKIIIQGPQGSGKSVIAKLLIDTIKHTGIIGVDTDSGESYTYLITDHNTILIQEIQTI